MSASSGNTSTASTTPTNRASTPETIALHLRHLSRLSASNPVEFILSKITGIIDCTVVAFDRPLAFSLIAGVLAATGFRIENGFVFTLHPPHPKRPGASVPSSARHAGGRGTGSQARRRQFDRSARDPFRRRVIIDRFHGHLLDPEADFTQWSERFTAFVTEVVGMLDRGDPHSIERAKHRVNELVTELLVSLESVGEPMLLPVRMDIEPAPGGAAGHARLTIVAQDTPAFLYSLSTALSLRGLSIERVRIGGEGDRVEDEIDVIRYDGKSLDEHMLERVRLSVLLTKQFAYFLDRSPDPFAALSWFEFLTEQITGLPEPGKWIDLLGNPRAMHDLAQLLGTSDYLWEDFSASGTIPFCGSWSPIPKAVTSATRQRHCRAAWNRSRRPPPTLPSSGTGSTASRTVIFS